MNNKQLRKQLSRQAIVLEIGGFRPPEDPAVSWFGRVNLALSDEDWPQSNDRPMLALCQLNLTELPYRPARLDDIAMITVFVDATELPVDQDNGDGWCLRFYKDISMLQPLQQPGLRSPIKAFPMKPRAVKEDFPCHADASKLGIDTDDDYEEHFKNTEGFKLGGWPTLIQSEISWSSEHEDTFSPEYVFQIDSNEKAQWQWGHGGVGYFGRGTTDGHTDQWTLAWQCF